MIEAILKNATVEEIVEKMDFLQKPENQHKLLFLACVSTRSERDCKIEFCFYQAKIECVANFLNSANVDDRERGVGLFFVRSHTTGRNLDDAYYQLCKL